MGPGVCLSVTTYKTFLNFTGVTLADDDTNSILADDANRAIWGWWLLFRWWSSPMSIIKGVVKVVVQELHGILEVVCW